MAQDKNDTYRTDEKSTTETGSDIPGGDDGFRLCVCDRHNFYVDKRKIIEKPRTHGKLE